MPILQRHRKNILCFNDDIQGTAVVVLAGVYGAMAAMGLESSDITKQTFVLCGAGRARACQITLTAFGTPSLPVSLPPPLPLSLSPPLPLYPSLSLSLPLFSPLSRSFLEISAKL